MHPSVDVEGAAHDLVILRPLVDGGCSTVIRIQVASECIDVAYCAAYLVYHVALCVQPFDKVNLAASSGENVVAADIGYFSDFQRCKERLDSDKQLVNLQSGAGVAKRIRL